MQIFSSLPNSTSQYFLISLSLTFGRLLLSCFHFQDLVETKIFYQGMSWWKLYEGILADVTVYTLAQQHTVLRTKGIMSVMN